MKGKTIFMVGIMLVSMIGVTGSVAAQSAGDDTIVVAASNDSEVAVSAVAGSIDSDGAVVHTGTDPGEHPGAVLTANNFASSDVVGGDSVTVIGDDVTESKNTFNGLMEDGEPLYGTVTTIERQSMTELSTVVLNEYNSDGDSVTVRIINASDDSELQNASANPTSDAMVIAYDGDYQTLSNTLDDYDVTVEVDSDLTNSSRTYLNTGNADVSEFAGGPGSYTATELNNSNTVYVVDTGEELGVVTPYTGPNTTFIWDDGSMNQSDIEGQAGDAGEIVVLGDNSMNYTTINYDNTNELSTRLANEQSDLNVPVAVVTEQSTDNGTTSVEVTNLGSYAAAQVVVDLGGSVNVDGNMSTYTDNGSTFVNITDMGAGESVTIEHDGDGDATVDSVTTASGGDSATTFTAFGVSEYVPNSITGIVEQLGDIQDALSFNMMILLLIAGIAIVGGAFYYRYEYEA